MGEIISLLQIKNNMADDKGKIPLAKQPRNALI